MTRYIKLVSIFLVLFVLNQSSFAGRIVAVGDLHGDINATISVLELAGVIDGSKRWIGQDATLVLVGDQIDKGEFEKEVIDFLEDLGVQAKKVHGRVYPLIGNHESLNVLLFFISVKERGFNIFSDFYNEDMDDPILSLFPVYKRGRAVAFKPGGPYAKVLASHKTILKKNGVIFVHGGLFPEYAKYGIEKINSEISNWMLGNTITPPESVRNKKGPLWNRAFSKGTGVKDCKILDEVLKITSAKMMVVAHTIQKEEGINSACGGKVWRIDTGLSYATGGGPKQVLEIENGRINIIREHGY